MNASVNSSSYDFDLAVVGGGSGGYAAARTAAQAGLSVAVIEGGEEIGGLCILRGCMPTKTLLYAADVIHLAREGSVWGLQIPKVEFDFKQVMARKDALIREFAEDRRQGLTQGNFKFLRASARFLDPHTLSLSTGETFTARHFVISTGSVVSPPPLPQLEKVGYLTSDSALKLKRLPRSLIILGGGSVAVEFAQFFARFDVQVTLIQRSSHILRDFDEDTADVLVKVFRREGMKIYTGTQLTDVWQESREKAVAFQYQGERVEVRAEEIFYALGRNPHTGSLGLENAGVKTENGRILADERMQTSASHVYTAGDCTGPYEIVHIAVQQGEIAAHNISRPDRPRTMDYRLLTNVVFTDPQLATVGLTEKTAQAQNIEYRAASYPFNDHGKSLIMEAKDGFVKLLAAPDSGEILGGACIGPVGGELIHEIIAAMAKRMTVHELAAMPHYHPTLAEIWTYPAEDLMGQTSSV